LEYFTKALGRQGLSQAPFYSYQGFNNDGVPTAFEVLDDIVIQLQLLTNTLDFAGTFTFIEAQYISSKLFRQACAYQYSSVLSELM
jgi:hypothetical protein